MDQTLKIKEGFILKNIADNYVVVSVGEGNVNFNSMITTNQTGSFLWEKLKDGATKQQLVGALLAEYDVEEEIAVADVERFVQKLYEKNILA